MRGRATRRLGMDMFLMLFLSMGAVLYILLPLINIPKPDEDQADPKMQGNLLVEAFWPDGWSTDVDLWVQAPGDQAVGYSNKGAIVFNLLRDDLGTAVDLAPNNMEVAFTRGIPDGEYTVNAHLFNNHEGTYPVPVRIVVSLKQTPDDKAEQLFSVSGELRFKGEERTFARFKLDGGEYVPDSFHSITKNIRSFVEVP